MIFYMTKFMFKLFFIVIILYFMALIGIIFISISFILNITKKIHRFFRNKEEQVFNFLIQKLLEDFSGCNNIQINFLKGFSNDDLPYLFKKVDNKNNKGANIWALFDSFFENTWIYERNQNSINRGHHAEKLLLQKIFNSGILYTILEPCKMICSPLICQNNKIKKVIWLMNDNNQFINYIEKENKNLYYKALNNDMSKALKLIREIISNIAKIDGALVLSTNITYKLFKYYANHKKINNNLTIVLGKLLLEVKKKIRGIIRILMKILIYLNIIKKDFKVNMKYIQMIKKQKGIIKYKKK